MIKSFTDLEQSKKLAEILPIESADMALCSKIQPLMTDYISAKMKEAGYEWDVEKKELRKFEQKPRLLSDFFKSEYERGRADAIAEIKSTKWSEEDEKMLNGIIDEIEANRSDAPSYDIPVYEGYLNWLESIKERIGG